MNLRYALLMVALVGVCAVSILMGKPSFPENVVKEPTKAPADTKDKQPAGPLDFTVETIDGTKQPLSAYKGKVVMIVNVASKCGFTKQYTQLEAVYKKYADQGFVILGFPANNFGGQEPGTNEEIKQFCSSKYDVTFPMMAKISVLGDDKAPLYKFLTDKPTAGDFAGDIGWNFNKFIVDRNGNLIARYNSKATPDAPIVTSEIEKALAAPASK
jgi:glutathione peroxidase